MRFERLHTKEQILAAINFFNWEEVVACDTETTGLNPRTDALISVVLGVPEYAVSFGPEHVGLLSLVRPRLIFQNFRFDYSVLMQAGVNLETRNMRDTMLMHHLVNENEDHSLDYMVKHYFNDNYKEVFWAKYDNIAEAPEYERTEYECKDACYTAKVDGILSRELARQGVPESLVEHVHRLAVSLWKTEQRGIGVDLPYLTELGGVLKADIVKTESELRSMSAQHCAVIEHKMWADAINKLYSPRGKKWQTLPKPEFNFTSTQQVSELLYGQLGLPVQISPKTRKPTADDAALEKLADLHPIASKLRELRKFSKMQGAFVDGVLDRMEGGRIYPRFNVNGTVTGRISHADPNMGQMPSRGEWSKIRGIFVPSDGNALISSDYSQLEVCIAAHFSLDKNLLKIIHEGASKHDITAQGLGIDRSLAKTINFAQQYGCTPHKVAQILGCSLKEAEFAWNKYWETYSGEKAIVDECRVKVDRGEPIINPFGRRRRFPTTFESRGQREAAYRQAYSSLIQGTGSEFTSYSFYTLSEWLTGNGYGRGWFTVHDEVLEECQLRHVEEVRAKTVEVMEGAANLVGLRVPLKVSCSEGLSRWQK